MRRFLVLSVLSLAAVAAAVPTAEAQPGRRGERGDVLILNVRPRSWLDAGNVVEPGAQMNPASPLGQYISYRNLPPYQNWRDRYGEGVLPDPVTNGPFIGARNPIGPIDIVAPDFLR